ncbi:MAG: zinc-dependent metalloprotease [Bacteriovoracaceae bacterium]|nr:zinc-dependent metalloprotease [Bacteriovoracaceae bacterium]
MFKSFASLVLTTVFLAGCAKEKSYEESEERIINQISGVEHSKSSFECTLEDPCLWVPSVTDTPYNVAASRPFWQGDEKLVVTKFTEDKLQILQVEEDERFNDNINNFSPVAEFEVSHVDYKCKEDSLGKCSNVEEEDEQKMWDQKRFARLESFSVVEKNSLPIQFNELFQAGCYSQVGQSFTGEKKVKVEAGAVNIKVKAAYEANPNCVMLQEMEDLRYLTFTVDYHYSLVKLSSIADPSYKKVEYPSVDESFFGFFKTVSKKKTVDNHDHYMGLRTSLMNRWSPSKKELVYYLNEDFYKPEMAHILKATEEAIRTVNFSLNKANAGMKVVLKNGSGKDIGDVRNNFLVLVDDPQASGVIGYGPSVVNPKTGEIINARTVMYYGTIKKFISQAYDEMVDENANVMSAQAVASAPTSSMSASLPTNFVKTMDSVELSNFYQVKNVWRASFEELLNINSNSVDFDDKALSQSLKAFKEKMDLMARQSFFHASNVNFSAAVAATNNTYTKKWDQLTEQEREAVIKEVLPLVWKPTLVHEFGHNLGLRHNFYGSTDSENYYTETERVALGIDREVTYSSIMDYSYSNLNQLSVMGKYDIAALKFAYAREVDTVEGNTVQVPNTLASLVQNNQFEGSAPKKFKYCSDEHVSNDPLCNRFDEGTTNVEVVSHYINSYNKNYSRRNFRNRRYDFSGRYGDWNYAISTFNTMAGIRQFFDNYDQRVFRGDYKGEETAQLEDVRKASDLAFDALMNIVETPAYHCLEVFLENGQVKELGRALPFNEMAKGTQLEEYGITFDIVHGCDFLSYYEGQDSNKAYLSFGKHFNNSLDLTIAHDQKPQGDTSQIDARGFWMDKVVASIFLSSRSQSPTTIGAASNGNFLDYPQYKDRFLKFMNGLLNNKFTKEVEIKSGEQVIGKLPMTYSFESNHMINKSYNPYVNYVFGLDKTQNNMKSVMLKFLKENFKTSSQDVDLDRDVNLYHDFDASQLSPRVDVSLYNYDKIVEFKNTSGDVAYRFGLYNYNTYAFELVQQKEVLDRIKSLSEESQAYLYETMVALSSAASMEDVEAIMAQVSDEDVKDLVGNHQAQVVDYLNGNLSVKGILTSLIALTK